MFLILLLFSGQDKAVAKSKYEEDVYTNNHTVRNTVCENK